MIFKPEELQKLFDIIDFRFAKIAADVLGDKVLSQQDISLLNKFAPLWKKEIQKFPPYYQSYLFGRLSGILNKKQLQSLSYKDFNGYLTKEQFQKPTQLDLDAYNISLKNTYSYLKGIGNKIKFELSSSISNQEMKILMKKQRKEDLETIKEELSRGVLEKKSVPQIISDLGHKIKDWEHDWGRIVETEMQNIYELGAAQQIAHDHGYNAKVYKTVFSGACKYCIKFYTTQGIGSQPRIFKLSDLIANGTNIGRKQKEWLPTLGPVHPFCYDDKTEVLTNEGWKFFKDLNKKELFCSVNLSNQKEEWIKAVKWIDEYYNGDMYHRYGYDIDLMNTPNHNHVVWTGYSDFVLKKDCDIQSTDYLVSYNNRKIKITCDFKFEIVPYEGRIYDVELEKNHVLVVRRNGKTCLSGNCRCIIHYIPNDYIWDNNQQMFVPKPYERKIERRSKVIITVGNKRFEV